MSDKNAPITGMIRALPPKIDGSFRLFSANIAECMSAIRTAMSAVLAAGSGSDSEANLRLAFQ
ncbi:hypothetical protein BH20ACI2_BH20ACI2_12750 [soil metagenome]